MNIYQDLDTVRNDLDLSKSVKAANQDLSMKIQHQRDKIGELMGKMRSRRDKNKIEIQRSDYSEAEVQALVKISNDECIQRNLEVANKQKEVDEQKKQTQVLTRRNYINKFKLYLKKKRQRIIQEEQFKKEQNLNKQTKTTQNWVTSTKNDENDKIMFEFFFTQIDTKGKGLVHEIQVKQFLFDNPLIMKLFNLKREGLQQELEKFPRSVKNHFNLDEMINFFQKYNSASKPGLKSFVHIFDDLNIQIGNPNQFRICLLSEDHLRDLQEIYDQVDVEKVSIVDQDAFFHQIRESASVSLLFQNALHIVPLNLNLILESVLQMIDIETLDEDDKNISWNTFMNYLSNFPDEQQQVESAEPKGHTKVIGAQVTPHDEEDYFYSRMMDTQVQQKVASPVKEIAQPIKKIQKKTKRAKNLGVAFRPHRVVDSKISVPRPLSYEKRRLNHKLTLREQWVKELVAEKRQEEEQALKYRPFKANKIPFKVQDRNYYHELMEREAIRKRETREKCLKKIEDTSNPFTFNERDKGHKDSMIQALQDENRRKQEAELVQFKANPLPWFCSVKLFQRDRMMKEQQRQMKNKIRQQWLKMNSFLPPRMQEHIERQEIQGQESQAVKGDQIGNVELTFQPKEAKPIPDFEMLHKQWENKLSQSKKDKKTTKAIEPNFHNSKKIPPLQYMDQENMLRSLSSLKEDPMKKAKKVLSKKPSKLPLSTKKFDAQVDRVRQEKEYKQMLEQRQLYEDQQRFEKKQLFVPRVQNSWAISDQRQAQEQLRYQKLVQYYLQQKQQEEDFNNMMKDIFLRVYQKPLLMELASMPPMQGEEEQDQQEEGNQNIQQNYGYNGMNPIGEDDELEYMRQQEEDQLQEEEQQGGYQQEEEEEEDQQQEEEYDNQYEEQDEGRESPNPNYDNQQEDPEGVELVGDEAEGSGDEVEFAQEDYQQDYDGEEYIDMENISPELLKQLQEQAIAEGYDLNYDGQEDDAQEEYEEEEEEENQGFGYMQHHHSF